MAPRTVTRAPTTSSITNTHKIPSTCRSLVKSLCRLSRESLIDLALTWLEDGNQPTCAPYLACNRNLEEEAEEDYLHTPAESIADLRNLYQTFKTEIGTKREIIDRLLDGDWRRGVSLQQLAMIDFQHLQDHEASLRWTALKLVPLSAASEGKGSGPLKCQGKPPVVETFPRMHPSVFIRALKHEISPLVKAHYYLHRLPAPRNLTILRLYVADTPYANPISSIESKFTDSSRTLFIAFPDSCPYIYVALSGSSGGGGGSNKGTATSKVDVTALKRTVLEAVPKALSRPHQRYALEATALTAKNLSTMCTLRGNGKGGASQGAFSIFADASAEERPLNVVRPSIENKVFAADGQDDGPGISRTNSAFKRPEKRKILRDRYVNTLAEPADDEKQVKKRKMEVARRFGTTGLSGSRHQAPIDRLHIKLETDLTSLEDETVDTTSTANANPAKKGGKGSVLDTFDPHKNRPKPLSQPPPPSYLAQYISNTQPTSQTPTPTSTPTPSATAGLTLTFHGTDVFAGIRTLAELGFVNLDKMPAWMTGEEGVSTATVRNGAVVDGKGGGA